MISATLVTVARSFLVLAATTAGTAAAAVADDETGASLASLDASSTSLEAALDQALPLAGIERQPASLKEAFTCLSAAAPSSTQDEA